jgi:alkanesulfonate monooxygenase SsuD/methylene tetrahydromethanopterin reductase-like flavin-dependent oxidoreductase (luciferase family)
VKYGFVIPELNDPHEIVELAAMAEEAGWDGFFNWDSSYFEEPKPLYDAWLTLTAIAMRTERIRIGALLFALYRRRPWEVARESVTLDHLSRGRLVMPVGLGAVEAHGNGRFGLPTDRRTRAELVDEHLEVLTGLWRGEPFSHAGKHYTVEESTFLPTPVQKPRIPIWVVGLWPSERSLARALAYDGIVCAKQGGELRPADVREIVAYAGERRPPGQPFDVIVEGRTSADDRAAAAAAVSAWAEVGATWWIETMWTPPNDPAAVRARLEAGPPKAG